MTTPGLKRFEVRKLEGGTFVPSEALLIIEKELPISINGEHLATASVTPSMEREFVAGYLFGQGFIENAEEISSLEVSEKGAFAVLANADLLSSRKEKTSYRIVSGGGRTAYFETSALPRINSDLKIAKKDIFRAMNLLFEKASLYQETGGAHSAALFDARCNLLCVMEDIGRHNTLDKIIGYALLNKIDCAHTFMVSTGRMASEMVIKIARAGIPLVATKTAITDRGREIGEASGLTVIGSARDAGSRMYKDMGVSHITRKAEMTIYTGAERVL
jgi:FdhD protein